MTLVPMKKKCEVCGKIYIWSPDMGQIACPRCSKKQKKILNILKNRTDVAIPGSESKE